MDGLLPLQLGFSWCSWKARGWNSVWTLTYVCLVPGLGRLKQLGAGRVGAMWQFLYPSVVSLSCGIKVDGLSPGGAGLQRHRYQGERARWMPYCLLRSSPQSHAVLLPPHPICGGRYKDLPVFEGSHLSEGVLPSHCENMWLECIWMWTFLENTKSRTFKQKTFD